MTAAAPAVTARHLADQAVFRAVMDAMAHPGRVNALAVLPAKGPADWPAPLNAGAAAVALCLADFETPLWLDGAAQESDAAAWLRFHTGARITSDPRKAAFAFVTDPQRAPDFQAFALGSLDYPDRSTTLILQVESFAAAAAARTLTGPGIKDTAAFAASPLPGDFDARLAANRALAPRGVDFIFVSSSAVAALPRSTRLVARG
jgi:alpha-D-ribose 1-methylphosphonate 5-triphosphate synthase subunit PhnH